MRAAGPLVVSALTRVEVVAALWRKVTIGELSDGDAALLTQEFEADWCGTSDQAPLLTAVLTTGAILDGAAALVPRHRLRACDAVVLACALVVRELEPNVGFLVWDRHLAAAALREGMKVEPRPS